MIAENTKSIHFNNFIWYYATRIFSQILPLVFRKGKCTVILKKIYRADFLQKGKIGNFFPVKNNFLAWNFFHFFFGISFQL